MATPDIRANGAARPANLALQGGGSHGAFTWGVLDRLLELGGLEFAAISGTSAGAMNAVALADGWMRGGADGARERLHAFWSAVGAVGRFSPLQRMPWDILMGNWSVENNPAWLFYEFLSQNLSPTLANPFLITPLRDVVEAEIDFERVRACKSTQLFISATNVETGQPRIFETPELHVDVVMASACLPSIFPAVEIEGVPYWDGGYGGNPALFPFFYANAVEDVLLVQINPIMRAGAPASARDINNRIDEITFNAGLLREFRAIAFVKKLIDAGRISDSDYRDIRMHRIDADDALKELTAASKINAQWDFLQYLRDLGRAAADDWHETDYASVGHKATVELHDELTPVSGHPPRRRLGRRVRDYLASRKAPHAG